MRAKVRGLGTGTYKSVINYVTYSSASGNLNSINLRNIKHHVHYPADYFHFFIDFLCAVM